MARAVMSCRALGTSGATSPRGTAVSAICLMATDTALSDSKGSLPESISYIITPME